MVDRGGVQEVARRSEVRVLSVARQRDSVDRATLAAQSGLTPQAVTNVLGRLSAAGIVERAGTTSGGPGKPSHLYRLRGAGAQAVGVHVTRRAMRLVRVDLRGVVRSRRSYELPRGFGPADVISRLVKAVPGMRDAVHADGGVFRGVGIGMIGPLDQARGIVRDAYRVEHWNDVPLRARTEDALDTYVSLEKDVTAAVLGETWGAETSSSDTALIMLDEGVGAGLWLQNAVHRGAHTNSGEFGHTVIDMSGPTCVCGRRGCLEVVYDQAIAEGSVSRAAEIIAVGALNLVETLDIDRLALGGRDFLRNSAEYLSAVRGAIAEFRPAGSWRSVKTVAATHGADFVAVGAALGVLHEHYFDLRGGARLHHGVQPSPHAVSLA